MSDVEPYRYQSGAAHGGERPQVHNAKDVDWVFGTADPSNGAPKRNRLQLAAHRAKTDPNWRTYSARTRKFILDVDEREEGR